MTTLLINDSLILHDIQASSKEDALRQMAGNMLEQGVVKESYFDNALLQHVAGHLS